MDERARIVEECFWELSELVQVERVVGDGWLQVVAPGEHETRNGVVCSILDPHEADGRIDEMIELYSKLSTPFRWHVGPSSTPPDLGVRLSAHGFEHVDTLAGMCISTDADIVPPDPTVVVTPLDEGSERDFASVIASTFEHSEPVRERLLERLRDTRGADRPKHYVARVAGQVVGATSYSLMRRAGLLQGAAVLEEHRGRGVYRQMIRTRLEALRGEGSDLAVITARTSTSAPICERLGFERVCTIEVYRHPGARGP